MLAAGCAATAFLPGRPARAVQGCRSACATRAFSGRRPSSERCCGAVGATQALLRHAQRFIPCPWPSERARAVPVAARNTTSGALRVSRAAQRQAVALSVGAMTAAARLSALRPGVRHLGSGTAVEVQLGGEWARFRTSAGAQMSCLGLNHTPCFAYSGSAIPAEQNFQSTLQRICGWEPCAKAARNRLRHTRGEGESGSECRNTRHGRVCGPCRRARAAGLGHLDCCERRPARAAAAALRAELVQASMPCRAGCCARLD
jgi:hypothetical protein